MYDDINKSYPFSPSTHNKLNAITIHIQRSELEQLLIRTAMEKSQKHRFAFMESDKCGGYKLTFVKIEE